MIDEQKIEAEREHRKREALKSQGEVVEHLRVLQAVADPSQNNGNLERTHDAAIKLAQIIREDL